MENIGKVIREYFTWITLPNIKVSDVLEILILASLIYQVTKWVKNTRAWTLVKGIIFLMGFGGIITCIRLKRKEKKEGKT